MLPSDAKQTKHSHVLIYLITSDTTNLNHLVANLGGHLVTLADAGERATPESSAGTLMTFSTLPSVVAVLHTQSQIDLRILRASDALVVALDGSSGVGPETIELWQDARDMSLPRHFVTTNVVHGRADFDELSAIASRTMEPDLIVRYLPIDSDDESMLAGIYDLLTSEIQTQRQQHWVTTSADPEHIAITSTAREDLFDHLAYLGLDDATLENHRAGLPISVTKLESAWLHPDVVSITPVDDGIGSQVFLSWVKQLQPIWIPNVVQGNNATDVLHCTERIGIAVTENLVRMWGNSTPQQLIAADLTDQRELHPLVQTEVVIICTGQIPGATICEQGTNSRLLAPVF